MVDGAGLGGGCGLGKRPAPHTRTHSTALRRDDGHRIRRRRAVMRACCVRGLAGEVLPRAAATVRPTDFGHRRPRPRFRPHSPLGSAGPGVARQGRSAAPLRFRAGPSPCVGENNGRRLDRVVRDGLAHRKRQTRDARTSAVPVGVDHPTRRATAMSMLGEPAGGVGATRYGPLL